MGWTRLLERLSVAVVVAWCRIDRSVPPRRCRHLGHRAFFGALLAGQGLYTIAVLRGWLGKRIWLWLLLAGSAVAFVGGATVFANGLVINLQPYNPDPEYGPMSIAFVIWVHGAAVLAVGAPTAGRDMRRSV